MIQIPSLNNLYIFGNAVRMQVVPNASAAQIQTFFGVQGQAVLFGGSRGRAILTSGVFSDSTIAGIADAVAVFDPLGSNSIVGAGASTLIDTIGRSWPNVYFLGEFQPDPTGPRPGGAGWFLPYKLVLHGLQ